MGLATLDIPSSPLAYRAAKAGFDSQPEKLERAPLEDGMVCVVTLCLEASRPPRFKFINPWTGNLTDSRYSPPLVDSSPSSNRKSLADPPRLVPKRTTNMLNLSKEDRVYKYVAREEGEREVLHKGSQNRALHPSPVPSSPSLR
ncbi:uncharacterized protein ARMOST_12519 [Armillaria ostoyae]|uniref:Uncharacterized protein n=1 Tax=Armillaria ostoyae TaxID=47428 RepID=A0A284RK61_ARMOS|nr:uncharacterized protein ARMOST_12519 [Armillaria ostoyae]